MYKFALKYGFKNIDKFIRKPNVIQTLTPFYITSKFLNPKLFRYNSSSNCFNKLALNSSAITKKEFVNTSHKGFFPSLFIISFSIPFFWKSEEEEEENPIVLMMKRAILAMQRGDPVKAEQLLHIALKAAQEMDDEDAISYIYDLMANFALQNEEFKKAENLFVSLLKRLLMNGMADDDNAVVEISLKLASIYSNLGEHDKASQGFQFCIGTQETKLKSEGEENVDEDTLVLWAMSHDWFARFLLSLAHYDRAKEHFKRAYDVCVKVKGESDPQVAVLLNDLGSVCSLQQKYDEAIDYLNKAIDLAKLHESEDLPSFYVNLGTIYMQKKVYDEAEQNCKQGMRLAKSVNNEEALKESKVCLKTLKEIRT